MDQDTSVAPTLSPPGLPLGIYTNHWKKVVPHKSNIGGCQSSPREDRCTPSYSPSDIDYDFQGIFNTEV